MNRTAGLATLTTLVVLLAACGTTSGPAPSSTPSSPAATAASPDPGPAPHQLVLDVSGTATVDDLSYTIDGKSTDEHEVTLPWEKTFTFPDGTGRHEWHLTLVNSGGTANATATVDGQLVTTSSGTGGGTQNLDGDFTA